MKYNMGMGDMGDLKRFLDKLTGEGQQRKIKRSVPGKPSWIKAFKEMDKVGEEAMALKGKYDTLKKKFWADIEIELQDFTSSLQWNQETNEVEVLVDEDERQESGKPIPSPFQK